MGIWDEWKKIFSPAGQKGARPKGGSLLLLLLFLGMGLLLFNSFFNFDKKKNETPPVQAVEEAVSPWTEEQLAARLAGILAEIRGVSDVELFLTPETSGRLELAADREQTQRHTGEGDSEGGKRDVVEETLRTTYVILRDPQGNELPLVVEEGKMRYRGVLAVADGVDDPVIKERVIEALQVLLGLPAHRITVLPR